MKSNFQIPRSKGNNEYFKLIEVDKKYSDLLTNPLSNEILVEGTPNASLSLKFHHTCTKIREDILGLYTHKT